MRILFLFTELADYFLKCTDRLISCGHEVHIVRWPVNKEAPFDFKFNPSLAVYNRNDFNAASLLEKVQSLNPDFIYCSGWLDKAYLKVAAEFSGTVPVVLGLDNSWKGTWKQYIATIASPFFLKNKFTHCWVPGELQAQYARKLGFPDGKIHTGFYSCDFNLFNRLYHRYKEKKQEKFPKRFFFAGRYVSLKGIDVLWNTFILLQEKFPNEWELWCAGTGPLAPVQHPKIKHLGFVQPQEMEKYIEPTGVFILPSRFEPWGVAVHEFAAAGYPLILSDEVGARTAFLKEGENGFLFSSGSVKLLMDCMKKIIQTPEEKLNKMGETSARLASAITPHTWVDTVEKIANEKNIV